MKARSRERGNLGKYSETVT